MPMSGVMQGPESGRVRAKRMVTAVRLNAIALSDCGRLSKQLDFLAPVPADALSTRELSVVGSDHSAFGRQVCNQM